LVLLHLLKLLKEKSLLLRDIRLNMNNFIVIVLDSVGIGALGDAALYGDEKAATLQHIFAATPDVKLPNLEKLGLGKIEPLHGISSDIKTIGGYGKMASQTKGKDTIVGHWELMGIILEKPFNTFTKNGFTKEILDEFTKETGYGWLGNVAESGTEIIKRLGKEHMETKKLIVYTSSDSVFQIAAHEDIIPIEELYRVCEITRKICDKYMIGRVIARPFITKDGKFVRTQNRKDFSMLPPEKTALNYMMDANVTTVGIGKIDDIFASSSLVIKDHSHGNPDCISATIKAMKKYNKACIFTNLVDFDMLYGHRRDVKGYYNCLKEFDDALPDIINAMDDNDILILTADHGNDPTHKGTDHTREYIPLLAFCKSMKDAVDLGVGKTFANVGKTALDYYKIKDSLEGKSFLEKLIS